MPAPLIVATLGGYLARLLGGTALKVVALYILSLLLAPLIFMMMSFLIIYLLISTEFGVYLVRYVISKAVELMLLMFNNFNEVLPPAQDFLDSFADETIELLYVLRIFDLVQVALYVWLIALAIWLFRTLIRVFFR